MTPVAQTMSSAALPTRHNTGVNRSESHKQELQVAVYPLSPTVARLQSGPNDPNFTLLAMQNYEAIVVKTQRLFYIKVHKTSY